MVRVARRFQIGRRGPTGVRGILRGVEKRRWNGIWVTKSSEDPVLELCTFIYVRVSGQWGSYRTFRKGTGTGGYMRWRVREGSRYGKKVCMCSSSVRCVPVRTYALYGQKRWVLAVLICTYMTTLVLEVWPLQFAIFLPFPQPFNECILATAKESGLSAISIWIGIALFDVVVTGLTIYKTMSLYKAGIHIPLADLLQRDGQFSQVVIWFNSWMDRNILLRYAPRTPLASSSVDLWKVVIVGLNMLMVILFAFADGVVKVMNAPFTHIITVRAILPGWPFHIPTTLQVVVASHLMLNLKVEGAKGAEIVMQGGRSTPITHDPASTVGEWVLNRTVHSTENPMSTFLQVYSQPEGDREEGPILDIRPQRQHLRPTDYELVPVVSTHLLSPLVHWSRSSF